jgi:hypothetical protein
MKILITGDVSTWNIKDFSVNKINPKFIEKIKKADYVIYNLEGPIAHSNSFASENKLQFRENFFSNTFYSILNKFNMLIRKKPQYTVYSNKKIISLLKLNRNTLVTLANNHIKDLGKKGFEYTSKELEENNIEFIGAGKNNKQVKNFYEFKDIIFININLIGAYKYKFPLKLYSATKDSFGSAYIDFKKLKQDIKRLRKKDKKIVLIIHGGKELPKSIKELNLNFDLIKNLKADITIIHHPHIYVKTKYEKDNIFVLGDFIFNPTSKNILPDRESGILEADLRNKKVNCKLIKFNANEVYGYG